MIKRHSIVVLAALLCSPAMAFGQQKSRTEFLRTNPQVMTAFKDLAEKGSACTVRVTAAGKEAALGTVVGADGWVLTKASEIKGKTKIVCKLKDGTELEAKVVNTNDPHDLALLKIEAADLTVVKWADSRTALCGHWLVTPGLDGKPAAIGVLSVETRHVAVSTKTANATPLTPGDLGIELHPDEAAPTVAKITPGGPAAKAGVKVKDTIVGLDKHAVEDQESLLNAIEAFKPGDSVKLRVKRGDDEKELTVPSQKAVVGKAGNIGDQRNAWGSKLSTRRSGFPTIFQHDSIVSPSDCGGPILDLDGCTVGINISRAGRAETYAVPAEVIVPLLKKLMPKS